MSAEFLEFLHQDFFIYSFLQLLGFILVGAPIGYLLVYRNLGLFSDTLSHSLLPGLSLAIFFFGLKSLSLFMGALAWGALVSFLFALLGGISSKKRDTILVVISLVGISSGLILNQGLNLKIDLTHLLFGSPLLTTQNDLIRSFSIYLLILVLFSLNWKKLVLFSVDAHYAQVKFGKFKINFLFTFLTTLLVISGFEMLGVLLTTGLLILPSLLFSWPNKSLPWQILTGAIFSCTLIFLSFALSYHFNITQSSLLVFILSISTLLRFLFSRFA